MEEIIFWILVVLAARKSVKLETERTKGDHK